MTEIRLSQEDKDFIDRKVIAGEYGNADEVVSAALRSLEREDDRVRQLVADADAQIAAGTHIVFSNAEAVADSIIDRGMKILSRRS